MSAYPDHILRVGSQHLAELKRKAADFERQLWDAHESLEQEIEQSAAVTQVMPGGQEAFRWTGEDGADRSMDGRAPQEAAPPPEEMAPGPAEMAPAPQQMAPEPRRATSAARREAPAPQRAAPARHRAASAPQEVAPLPNRAEPAREDPGPAPETVEIDAGGQGGNRTERTARLIDHGRRAPMPSHRGRNTVLAGLAVAVLLLTLLVVAVTRPGPSWPTSVATVERQIATACRNPDVRSEPNLVNFACGKSTQQILWVFSLMTSGNNPDFASIKTGRQGLEPITPAQGGQVAWSLNLHHPYNPANPIDSLQVAARAINNIIGGATLTAANGKPVVQPGLVSVPANCAKYTGSAAVTSRAGYPAQCAKPITSPAGQGKLVADVFRKWMVGAPPSAAKNAAVLFQNADNPGDPRVRAILRSLNPAKLSG